MCRINGIISPNFSIDEITDFSVSMSNAMSHGGPDDEGVYSNPEHNVVFGHRRLSILDLTKCGHQPMADDNLGFVWITFNGEIFNFNEIKKQLIDKGHVFSTRTDTEIIIKAYLQWGEASFNMFNGMFAFSIFDNLNNVVYLVRDSKAIKPLYYYIKDDTLIFSSEIRGFLSLPIKFEEDPDWKLYFLVFGNIPEPYTTLKDVKMLPKGQFIKFNLKSRKHTLNDYSEKATLSVPKTIITDKKEAINILKKELEEAVERQLISDVPVGVFLSGGIDSTILALLALKVKKENLFTLSTIFNEPGFSERKYQQIVVNKMKNKHKELLLTAKHFNDNIQDIVKAYDQPSVDGINTYFISKFAKESGIKVVLTGIGADEIFGGYPSFKKNKLFEILLKQPEFLVSNYKYSPDFRLKKVEYLKIKDNLAKYLLYRSNYSPDSISKILHISPEDIFRKLKNLFVDNYTHNLNEFDKASWLETNLYMQNQLLKDTDYMSMWHGIEARVPYLDNKFVDATNTISSSLKGEASRNKDLLVSAFEDIMPKEIWDRPKNGFSMPFQTWMKNPEFIDNMLNSNNSYIKKITNLFVKDKVEWSRFWSLYMLDVFDQKHSAVKQNSFQKVSLI